MSLDVYLYSGGQQSEGGSGIFIREDGRMREITRAEWDEKFPSKEPIIAMTENSGVFRANITHNLGRMAEAAGIYQALWRPDENNITQAYQLIDLLTNGIERLKGNPDYYRTFNPSNGWGGYEGLVDFVSEYLEACKQYPTATVWVSR